jgi:tetratricopeptide (TPR) repeat protein
LANRLHDARAFPGAVSMYERYLKLNPSNPDARVDLGISYFELALGDSLRREEYFGLARKEMQQALQYAPSHQLAHFNLGIVSLHTGDMMGANEWFRKCVKIDPNSEIGKKAQTLINQHSFQQPS